MVNLNGYVIRDAGDAAVTVEFGDTISPELNARVHALKARLLENPLPGIIDLVPTFRSLLICYDPRRLGVAKLKRHVARLAGRASEAGGHTARTFVIPVCYGGEYGPDIAQVVEHTGLPQAEVIALHTAPSYLIYMLGFLPGFSYLGGLDKRLETPRLKQPRAHIPAGSVGIGGSQTGVYPMDSPGGWRLIGRTPVRPYDGKNILYGAGDYIRFKPIDAAEYQRIEQAIAAGTYTCEVTEGGGAQ